jgi:hypothetical protein
VVSAAQMPIAISKRPVSDRRRVFPWALNPFDKLGALVALEADHIEKRIAGIRIMGSGNAGPVNGILRTSTDIRSLFHGLP